MRRHLALLSMVALSAMALSPGASMAQVAAPVAVVDPFPYCGLPPELPAGPFTAGTELVQVQVVTRHGDRTPIQYPLTDPIPWSCELQPTLGLNTVEELVYEKDYLEAFPLPPAPVPSGYPYLPPSCLTAQLTLRGQDQLVDLGSAMRDKYVDALGLLPPRLADPGLLFARSSDVSRTLESAQSFLLGLYPEDTRPDDLSIPLYVRPPPLENIQPDETRCPALMEQIVRFTASPRFPALVEPQLDLLGRVAAALGLPFDPGEEPFASAASRARLAVQIQAILTAMDNSYARLCHDRPLQAGITPPDTVAMRRFADQMTASLWTFEPPKTVRLGIGSFLVDIAARQGVAVAGEPGAPLALYSAHDATFWPLLAILGVPNDVEIPYGAHLAFELWRGPEGGYRVAVDFGGRYLELPACPSPCRYETFAALVGPFLLPDPERACRVEIPSPQPEDAKSISSQDSDGLL